MTTDNRTNEPTPEQVEAAAKAIADCHNPGMFEKYPENWRVEARAALATAGTAPQAESEAKLWCETHQHTHIATMPRFTYQCKDCGWGQWYRDQAREHEYWTQENQRHAHETYEVEHVMVPLPVQPSSTVDDDALAKAWHEGFCRGEASGAREVPMNPDEWNPYRGKGGERRGE